MGNGFSGGVDNSWNRTVEVTTPVGTTYNGAMLGATTISTISLSISQVFAAGQNSGTTVAVPGEFKRIDIISSQTYGNLVVGGTTVIDRSGRTDCAARPYLTYDEELKNYANWVAWYRSRLQMMKSSVSQAFQTVDTRYRVGFITINDRTSNYLAISKFNTTQKANWYAKLFNVDANGGTPLRSTLARVGRIFAGQARINTGDEDPVEYSCQQNFALLTTDGYWNSDSTATTNNPDVRGLIPFGLTTNSQIGNQDADPVPRPQFEGPTATFNTLADVAKYFNIQDLRDATLAGYGSTTASNCLVSGTDDDISTITYSNRDVCPNNVFVTPTDNNVKQHMTTFTLGLGVDGTLQYQPDYKTTTDTNSDFYRIKNGTGSPTATGRCRYRIPKRRSMTCGMPRSNGGGTYFSAKDPAQLNRGLNSALASITAQTGAGAAAATSTLTPTNGDNFAYVASYTTAKWTGTWKRAASTRGPVRSAKRRVGAWKMCRAIRLSAIRLPPWSRRRLMAGTSRIALTRLRHRTLAVTATGFSWRPPPARSRSDLHVQEPCCRRWNQPIRAPSRSMGGAVRSSISMTPSRRQIPAISILRSWPAFRSGSRLAAPSRHWRLAQPWSNYLRGNKTYEDSNSNTVPLNRLFRYREAVFGDLIEAQPVFMGKPQLSYVDAGYSAYAVAQTTQYATTGGTVYAASNDGMLHAFDARNGNERWAYIPTPVLPELWRLADNAYGSNHRNDVIGSPVVTDVDRPSNCGTPLTARWRNIIVGGLNGGGRGYYAIDVTNPDSPSLMWEFTNANDKDLGYTFGNPIITKKNDGTWVVVFASGYNNAVAGNDTNGDGKGYVYVLDANSGVQRAK